MSLKNPVSTRVQFFSNFSRVSPDSSMMNVVFYDQALTKIPGLKTWLKKFDLQIPLQAGEALKSAPSLEKTIQKIFETQTPFIEGRTRFYAVGGGTVGDFVGFLSSTFLQGVDLIHVPTTWISAMDSAHGGRTGLNAAGVKNILSTFHPAKEAWIIQDFFRNQKGARLQEALGDAARMALLDATVWKASGVSGKKPVTWSPERLWKLLPIVIEAKLRLVRLDPLGTKGTLSVLGLGQTLGHALESAHGISHGKALGVGLFFALWVSWCEGLLSSERFFALEHVLSGHWGLSLSQLDSLRMERYRAAGYILRDKKAIASGEIQFIGLSEIGRPEHLVIPIDDLLDHLDGMWS
ncbi:MAG: hypothetical protein KGQ59_02095 [Bdellovibrionales bacterium]|nr:hypothetical protein [Bdellovibrionales bacterium]